MMSDIPFLFHVIRPSTNCNINYKNKIATPCTTLEMSGCGKSTFPVLSIINMKRVDIICNTEYCSNQHYIYF